MTGFGGSAKFDHVDKSPAPFHSSPRMTPKIEIDFRKNHAQN